MYQQNPSYPNQPGYGYPPPAGAYPPQSAGDPQKSGGYPYGSSAPPPAPPPMESSGESGFGADPVGLFAEKAIRQAFVSKVYTILTIQLIFTSVLIGMLVLNDITKDYFAASQVWLFLGMGVFLVAYLILLCVESARRTTPINIILLSIATLGYGIEAAVISCRYDTQVVMYAFLATGVSCSLIALFAKTTSFDMTSCGTTLCLIGLGHMFIGILLVAILVPLGYSNVVSLLLAISGALIASLYLIFDLQLIMGGRKGELSPEEYILASVLLYVHIIQIFLYLLEIIARLTKSN